MTESWLLVTASLHYKMIFVTFELVEM